MHEAAIVAALNSTKSRLARITTELEACLNDSGLTERTIAVLAQAKAIEKGRGFVRECLDLIGADTVRDIAEKDYEHFLALLFRDEPDVCVFPAGVECLGKVVRFGAKQRRDKSPRPF